jgi:uncharacterized protein (DUF1684 family)
MTSLNRNITLVLFFMILTSSGISQTKEDSSILTYDKEIGKYRNGINIKLMYGESTPLLPEQLKNFKGLKYFEPNLDYLIEATLVKASKQEDIIMKTSGDRTPVYVRYGVVKFMLKGMSCTLAVFQNKKMLELSKDTSALFIPFRDETCGKESYGGGRYIDCEIPATGDKVMLDFNKAYNPYCAYNHNYSCVIPPEENRLAVRIEAGEKVFEEH